MGLGERLSRLRLQQNLSQSEVANRLNIAKSTLAMYETNKREPSFDTIEKLCAFFHVTIDYLITGKTVEPTKMDPSQAEFLRWIEENLEESFFYDFDKSHEESKREMMETLKFVWEREKRRKLRQRPGE